MGEHTHLPTAPHRYGDAISDDYKKFYDPFVVLSVAAAVTQRLKLGTAVCLLTEHHPITLAKLVATLDHVSGGRVVLGVVFVLPRQGRDEDWATVRSPVTGSIDRITNPPEVSSAADKRCSGGIEPSAQTCGANRRLIRM